MYQSAEEKKNVCRMNAAMQQLLSLTSSSLLNQTAGRRNNIGMLAPDSPSHQFSYQKVAYLTNSPLEGQTPVWGTKSSVIMAQVTLFICSCHLSYHHDAGVGGCGMPLRLSDIFNAIKSFPKSSSSPLIYVRCAHIQPPSAVLTGSTLHI